jgi:hypothetical protein
MIGINGVINDDCRIVQYGMIVKSGFSHTSRSDNSFADWSKETHPRSEKWREQITQISDDNRARKGK